MRRPEGGGEEGVNAKASDSTLHACFSYKSRHLFTFSLKIRVSAGTRSRREEKVTCESTTKRAPFLFPTKDENFDLITGLILTDESLI